MYYNMEYPSQYGEIYNFPSTAFENVLDSAEEEVSCIIGVVMLIRGCGYSRRWRRRVQSM